MKVLSLFDGMACGMIAMQLAGVDVGSYDAYEIDKYAIKTAQHNFPMIKEHGDVFNADFTQYDGVDFLIGGSPCTYWSIAQTKNRETVASGMGWELFSQYVRALHEAKPKYFIYENNKSMSKDIRASIDKAFGFEAVLINSALVSAQNRQRLYWVGRRNEDGTYSKVNVEQPADRGILLKDVLDSAVASDMAAEPINITDDGKSQTLKAQYTKNNVDNFCCYSSTYGASGVAEPINVTADGKARTTIAQYGKQGLLNSIGASGFGCTSVAEPVCLRYERTEEAKRCRKAYEAHEIKHGYNELNELHPRPDGKTNTLTTVLKDNQIMEPVCVAERGRMYCGQPQHYEARTDGKTNTLTSVEKDNRVDEPVNITQDGKAQCLRATYYKDGIRNMVANTVDRKTCVAEPIRIGTYPTSDGRLLNPQGSRIYSVDGEAVTQSAQGGGYAGNTGLYAIPTMPVKEATAKGYTEIECGDCVDLSMPNSKTRRGRNMADKANCMQTSNDFYQYVGYVIEFDDDGRPIKAICKDGKEITIYEVRDGKITIKGKQYPIKLKDGYYIIRKLTVSECKRLQTVPEWYEFPVSDSQAYKMLGNGWTCEVIAHILKYLKEA